MDINDFEKSLQDLSNDELVKILDEEELSNAEFDILVEKLRSRGMSGRVIEVDGSPDDEQGMQLMEYLSYHEKMPKYKNEIEEDKGVKESIKTLKNIKASLEDKKIAIIILAHAGRLDALSSLEKYAKNPLPELVSWVFTAIGECQMFLEGKLTDTPKMKVKKLPKKK